MWFDSWSDLGRILLVGVLAYVALVVLLRAFGKRMLSKMSAFDLVVTVALGSTLSTIITSRDLPLADGLTALVVLLGLQYVLAWSAARSDRVDRVIKSTPTLLFFRGEFLRDAMRDENISESGVNAYIRSQGIANLASVEAVVLESDGSMNVIAQMDRPATALHGVRHYPVVAKHETQREV